MLSIIVPVMNEEGSLRQLWDEIVAVCLQESKKWKTI